MIQFSARIAPSVNGSFERSVLYDSRVPDDLGGHSMQRFALALMLAMSTTAGTTTAGEADKAPAPEDRYLWLEDVTGDKSLDWARARNAESAKVLGTPEEAALEKRILDILDSKERIPGVEKLGPWYYNFWKDAKNPRGLWRRTTLAEYRKPEPAWETVIDVDALGAAEKENWVWHGRRLPEARLQALPGLALARRRRRRRGARVRPRDEAVREGRILPARGQEPASAGWTATTLYVGTDFGPGSMTTSGYPRIAKVWKRGTPLDAGRHASTRDSREDVAVVAFRDHTTGLRARLRAARADVLHRRALPAPRRQAGEDREARRRQGERAPRPAARSSFGTTGRSAARRTRRARCSRPTSRPS